MTVFKNALVIQRKSGQPESTTAVLSIERQIPSPSPSPDPLTPRGGPVKWKDYGDGRCYCRWEIGDCTKVGRGSRWVGIKGRGGASLLYTKAICRIGVEVGVACAGWGESLDCIDPSEARFSPQVNLDMEKIMEKLGGFSQIKDRWIDRVSLFLLLCNP